MSAIFKRDFRSYFNSMIGYVFLFMFLIIVNIFFSISNVMSSNSSLTGVFSIMVLIILFTIPLLTMRTFSEDKKLRTDQLLYTAPVKLRDIVLGKFLAALGVFLLALVFTLLWVLVIMIYGTPLAAEIIGNYVGIICLTSAFIAIGMFVSSLTENQLIAAVGSYGIFFMMYIGDMVVSSAGSMFPTWLVRALSFLSVFTRYNNISYGLLALDDIVFFISITGLFLFLSYRVLDKKRWA